MVQGGDITMCRILIVDDEKPFCTLLERALRCPELEIVTTHDSARAAEVLRNSRPFDLLITDLDMPSWTGLDLARMAAGLSPAPKVLLMTAQKHILTNQRYELEGYHCLIKPFFLGDLRAKVALLTDCWHIFSLEMPGRTSKRPSAMTRMDHSQPEGRPFFPR